MGYAVFAALWIGFSDGGLRLLLTDPELLASVSMLKGWLFVVVTTVLLYGFLKTSFWQLEEEIKARAEAERAYRSSAELLRAVGDNLPQGYMFRYTRTAEGPRFLYVSAGVERMHGLKPQDVLQDARCLMGQIEREDLERLVKLEEESRRTLADFAMELRIKLPSGESRWMSARSKPRIDGAGMVIWDGFTIDVTDRKRVEEALRTKKAELDAALASMGDAVFISDRKGRLIEFNEAFASFHRLGSKADCPREHSDYPRLLEITFPDGQPAPVERWAVPRALAGESRANEEYILRRRDTGESWVGSYNFAPIKDAAGEIVGAVVTARDITGLVRAREALKASEERLRSLVTLLPDAMFINVGDRIVFVNDRAVALWRAKNAEEVLNRSPLDFIRTEERAKVQERIRQLLTAGGVAPIWETWMVAVDGTPIPVETTATCVAYGREQGILVVARDITQRRNAEENLLVSRSLLEDMGQIAQVGGWSLDVATGTGGWTNELARIHDLSPDEPINMQRGLDFYTEESRPIIAAAVQRAITTGESYDLDLEIVSAKGVRKWVHTIGHAQMTDGRVTRLRGSLQDVTEQHKALEERLRQQRRVELLAKISGRLVTSETSAELLSEVFGDLARELNIDIYANYMVTPAGDRLHLECSGGLTAEQQVSFAELDFGVSLCGLVAQRRERMLFADLPSATEPQAAGIIALGVRAYAGHPLMAGGRLIGTISFGSRTRERYDDGEVRLMKAVADQVAASIERQRLVAALREREESFREVVENIQEVFWVFDLAQRRVVYASPAFERIWKRSCEELKAKTDTWLGAIHENDRARVRDAFEAATVSGVYDEIYRVVQPDGRLRWVHDRGFPVRGAGTTMHRLVGVAEDITERHELETRFLRAQRMEAIGTLASGVAHDLNNILAPVMMVSGLLRTRLPDVEDQRLLGMVEQVAQRGAGIVSQLLTFSRGADGEKIEHQPEHLVTEIAHLLEETFPRNIRIRRRYERDLPMILANLTQLHQVLMNLCVNARDAMAQGGELTLQLGVAEVTKEIAARHDQVKPGRYVVMSVADTGTGIPVEVRYRIFDPFFTTKEVGKGTGLGLSTALGIVRSHGGFIELESQVGAGTRFDVYLPALPAVIAPPEEDGNVALPSGAGERVLVVDDEESMLVTLAAALETHGYTVLTASNGAEAFALFKERPGSVRAIITDLIMPVVDGWELARRVRQEDAVTPIILSSGLGQKIPQEELVAARVQALLSKPFEQALLLKTLARVLEPGANLHLRNHARRDFSEA